LFWDFIVIYSMYMAQPLQYDFKSVFCLISSFRISSLQVIYNVPPYPLNWIYKSFGWT